jgi:hypothetical protein
VVSAYKDGGLGTEGVEAWFDGGPGAMFEKGRPSPLGEGRKIISIE